MRPLSELPGALAGLAAALEAAQTPIVERLGVICEAAAKQRVGAGGAHSAGTPTPARRGGPPAVITGDVRRAVTHEMRGPMTVRVGAADIPHRPGKSTWRAPRATCGQIGEYLEQLGYMWLTPALEDTVAVAETEIGLILHALPW